MRNIIEIITTGEEILSGITQDTNFSWLCDSIFNYGLKVNYHQCVGDNLEPDWLHLNFLMLSLYKIKI